MPKDALHELIHSLSTSEKGYYIKSKGDSHLTILFKVVNKLEVYDKEVLKKRLNKHPDLLKHLAKYKNNSYSDIMNVMRAYRLEKVQNVDTRLKVFLMDITFLMERGLFENAMKILQSAKELALKYHQYGTLIELINNEIILSKRLYKKGYIETTRTLVAQRKKFLAIFNDEQRYSELGHSLDLAIQRNPKSTNNELKVHLEELMSDNLLINEERPFSFMSIREFHEIYAMYNNILGVNKKIYYHRKKIVDCWDANPHLKQIDFRAYTASWYNYISECVVKKKFEEVELFLGKLKKELNPKNPYEEAILFQRVYYIELFYYYQKADFKTLDTFIVDLQKKLKKYSKNMVAKDVYAFEMVISYILYILNRYEEAYKSFGELIKQKLVVRRDYLYHSWILRLIIAYESNYDNFDNLYRATQRFFDKEEHEETIEAYMLFMKFLYKINRSPESETKALFIACKKALHTFKTEKAAAVIEFEEISSWLEHIITKESLVDIYTKRFRATEPV